MKYRIKSVEYENGDVTHYIQYHELVLWSIPMWLYITGDYSDSNVKFESIESCEQWIKDAKGQRIKETTYKQVER